MTPSSDASQLADRRRRRDILRRTRMGLYEDLDDLRDQLSTDFHRFQKQLTSIQRDLPNWLDIPSTELHAPFCLEAPPPLEDCRIGPHAIASIATEFEALLQTWLGEGDSIPLWDDDPSGGAPLEDDLSEFNAMLLDAQEELHNLADEGPEGLDQILESIVFELQDRRETDVEALESLIQDGTVDPGRNARREIAELWEEQRRRVDHLRSIWDDLFNLHHRNISSSLDGIEEFQEFLRRLVDGLIGSGKIDHSPLSAHSQPTSVIDAGPTEPIDAPSSLPGGDPSPDEDTTTTASEIADTALMGQPLADAGPTEPIDSRPTDIDGLSSAGPSSTLETDNSHPPSKPNPTTRPQDTTDNGPDPQSKSTDLPRLDSDANPASPSDPHLTSRSVTSDAAPSHRPDDADPVDEQAPPHLRLRIHRQRTGWDEVGTDEILAAFGPPATFLGILFLMGFLSLFDLAPNPMIWWADTLPGEALPAALGALLLLALIPWVLKWRPMWHGLRFRWIRRDELIDDVNLRLSAANRLTVDRSSWDMDQLRSISLRRWTDDDAPGDQRGWLLTIEPPYHDPIHLVADIDNQTRWGQSNSATVDLPDGTWHCPPAEFHELADHLGASS